MIKAAKNAERAKQSKPNELMLKNLMTLLHTPCCSKQKSNTFRQPMTSRTGVHNKHTIYLKIPTTKNSSFNSKSAVVVLWLPDIQVFPK